MYNIFMSEDSRDNQPKQISRRNLLKRAGKIGLGLTLAWVVGIPDKSKESESSPTDKIRTFETAQGNAPLTFEQARLFVPMVIDVYRRGYQTLKSGSEVESNIYLFRTELEPYQKGQEKVTVFPDGTSVISTMA